MKNTKNLSTPYLPSNHNFIDRDQALAHLSQLAESELFSTEDKKIILICRGIVAAEPIRRSWLDYLDEVKG